MWGSGALRSRSRQKQVQGVWRQLHLQAWSREVRVCTYLHTNMNVDTMHTAAMMLRSNATGIQYYHNVNCCRVTRIARCRYHCRRCKGTGLCIHGKRRYKSTCELCKKAQAQSVNSVTITHCVTGSIAKKNSRRIAK